MSSEGGASGEGGVSDENGVGGEGGEGGVGGVGGVSDENGVGGEGGEGGVGGEDSVGGEGGEPFISPRNVLPHRVPMHKCPVCGEELYESRPDKIVEEHRGQTFHFCSEEHREEFEQKPGQYA